MATVLQTIHFANMLSTSMSIPEGETQMIIDISPSETLLLSFNRNHQDVSVSMTKQAKNNTLMEYEDDDEELEEYPIYQSTIHQDDENECHLPATIPLPSHQEDIEAPAEMDELETQQPTISLPIKTGRRYNYVLRNKNDFKINSVELGKYVGLNACKIVIDAIASVGNYPSTIDEMLVTQPGSATACAFRRQLRRLNKCASKSRNSIVHQANDESLCQHKGPHLICEYGRSVKTRFWIDRRIAGHLFAH